MMMIGKVLLGGAAVAAVATGVLAPPALVLFFGAWGLSHCKQKQWEEVKSDGEAAMAIAVREASEAAAKKEARHSEKEASQCLV